MKLAFLAELMRYTQLQDGRNRFNNPMTQEALRVFPMALRVEKYSWPAKGLESTIPRLPIIHITGDMGGPEYGPVRTMKGTVSLIGDNAVRWSMVSTRPLFHRLHTNYDPSDPQSCRRSRSRMVHRGDSNWCFG